MKNYTDYTKSERAELRYQRDINVACTALEFIHAYRAKLDQLDVQPSIIGSFVDFDNLDRPKLLAVLKAFPGRYTKEPGYDGGMHYTADAPLEGTSLRVRIYNGEAPACCIVEEKVEYVEVPARIERKVTRTIRCPEPEPAA